MSDDDNDTRQGGVEINFNSTFSFSILKGQWMHTYNLLLSANDAIFYESNQILTHADKLM